MKLKNPHSEWKPNPSILRIIRWSILAAYIGLTLLSIMSLVLNQGGFVLNYHVCLKEEPPEYKTGLSLTAILVLGFILIAILSSVTLDLFTLCKLWTLESKMTQNKTQVQPEVELPTRSNLTESHIMERKILDEIPLRSSLINTIFLLLYIFIVVALGVIGRNFSKQENQSLLGIPYFIISICRNWLVATLTFKKNDSNRQRNASEERERSRNVEIQFALKKRAARRENIFSIETPNRDSTAFTKVQPIPTYTSQYI